MRRVLRPIAVQCQPRALHRFAALWVEPEAAELKRNGARANNNRKWSAAAALLFCAGAAYSQDNSIDREIKAARGREVRVGMSSNIRPIALPGRCLRSASPLRRNMAPSPCAARCSKRPMSSNASRSKCRLLSRSIAPARFQSDDRFELEVTFPAGRKQLQRFHVSTRHKQRTAHLTGH